MAETAPLLIRPVTAADLDRLAELQEASILRLGTPVYGAAKARAWARMGHQFKHVLIGAGAFFTAERAGRSLGVGGWSPDSLEPELAWLRYVFVDPDHVRGISAPTGASSSIRSTTSPPPPRVSGRSIGRHGTMAPMSRSRSSTRARQTHCAPISGSSIGSCRWRVWAHRVSTCVNCSVSSPSG
jgi:hypothetical protein